MTKLIWSNPVVHAPVPFSAEEGRYGFPAFKLVPKYLVGVKALKKGSKLPNSYGEVSKTVVARVTKFPDVGAGDPEDGL